MKLGRVVATSMAKMGFSPQTTHFSSSSTRVSCRPEDRQSQSPSKGKRNYMLKKLKPKVRGVVDMGEENSSTDVWNGRFKPAHTAQDWGKASEVFKINKELYALSTNISGDPKTLTEEEIGERVEDGSRNMYEREGSGYNMMRNVVHLNDFENVFRKKEYDSPDKRTVSSDGGILLKEVED